MKRGLLRSAARYGELDVIEQTVLRELLAHLPKSEVGSVWHEARPALRGRLADADTALVWDPQVRTVTVTTSDAELRAAVLHARPVQVLPLGEFVIAARKIYRAEVEAVRRSAATNLGAASSGRSGTGDRRSG